MSGLSTWPLAGPFRVWELEASTVFFASGRKIESPVGGTSGAVDYHLKKKITTSPFHFHRYLVIFLII